MNLEERFNKYVRENELFEQRHRLLVAVSGGVDSVVLCDLLQKCGYNFIIAHCNFNLRGEDSEMDEAFVTRLAEKYATGCFVKKFDTDGYAASNKLSIQVAARELRYQWFGEIIHAEKENPFYGLLTAHHADDNIETLLMNFFKGTGIDGLQGIETKTIGNVKIMRPLLFARKTELLAYAKEHELQWREDVSNHSNKYTRNYFRNEMIPALQKVYPKVEENLLDNIKRFHEIAILYRQSVVNAKKKLVFEKQSGEFHIPVLKLKNAVPLRTIIHEIINPFGFTAAQCDEVIKLLNSESGKYIQSAKHRILRNRNWLIISALGAIENDHIIIEETVVVAEAGAWKLKLEKSARPVKINPDTHVAQLDAREISFPLLLRKWKQGDYFYPLGMRKKKKLSRFFIDQKLSLNEKENTWVLESGKKIIWVVGKRIDDRCKITEHTETVLTITASTAK